MTGNLDQALQTLITTALPGLFSGDAAVKLAITSDRFEVDPLATDAMASKPRPDDRTDDFGFDPDHPAGPYTLTQPPYPGPRRIYLTTSNADRIALQEREVIPDEVDARIFTLALRPNRELAGVTGVRALYGVTAVFTRLKAAQILTVQLQSAEAAKLEQAEALVATVIALNRPFLVESAQASFADGDYGAHIDILSLKLLKGTRPAADLRLLTLQVEMELKASRALREDEGRPITRIHTPGRPIDANRPVDIEFEV
jgi:hypothetical protein